MAPNFYSVWAIQGGAIEDNQSTSGCALCALIVSVFPYSTSRCNLRTLDLTSLYCRGKFHNTKEKTIVMAIVQGNPKDVVSPIKERSLLLTASLHLSGHVAGPYHSPAPTILQRLPFSSDYHSPATAILQRLPFSSDCHSPAPTATSTL
jgi:hypothetical protein